MFTEKDIKDIFLNKVKLPSTYFKKYENLPQCPIKSWNYDWSNHDFPRNWCVLDFIEWTNKYNLKNIEHLGYTYEADPELEFINSNKKTLLEYPKYDLHKLPDNLNDIFDFFIFNQTLEHLYDPFEAVRQIYKIIKSGGYVFTSVPTLNIPHMTPIHFNGFTPMGLAMLFKKVGFEIIEIGQWGNFEYIVKLWKSHYWPGYKDLNKNNIITNEENNVCQCWILAKKI
jgi:SAM-dependent methyltransferase